MVCSFHGSCVGVFVCLFISWFRCWYVGVLLCFCSFDGSDVGMLVCCCVFVHLMVQMLVCWCVVVFLLLIGCFEGWVWAGGFVLPLKV